MPIPRAAHATLGVNYGRRRQDGAGELKLAKLATSPKFVLTAVAWHSR